MIFPLLFFIGLTSATTAYTCNCFCLSSYQGTAYSSTCSNSACSTACENQYGHRCSLLVDGYCSSIATTSRSIPYTCVCRCSSSALGGLTNVGTTTSTRCSRDSCVTACYMQYPLSCTYRNEAYCSLSIGIGAVPSVILTIVITILLFVENM